jgi:hypothetical protein
MDEAAALSWKNDAIDIYSNSWGPSDSGTVIDGPGYLSHRALKKELKQYVSMAYIHRPANNDALVYTFM